MGVAINRCHDRTVAQRTIESMRPTPGTVSPRIVPPRTSSTSNPQSLSVLCLARA